MTGPARAAEPRATDARQNARTLADEGADAYARGDFARAHGLFVQAYALVPAPTVALFEARSLVELKRFLEARAAYVRASSAALSSDAPEPFRAAVGDARAELAALEPRIPRYRVLVEGSAVETASIAVDGRRLRASDVGAWLRADPGPHELRVLDSSREATTVTFELRERESKTVRVDAGASSTPARTLGFVSLGVGAAGIALGVSAGLVALNAHDDAERGCPERTCVPGSRGADALDRFEDFRTLSTVGYAVGAVGAATGLVLILGAPGDSKPRVALSSTFGALELEATF